MQPFVGGKFVYRKGIKMQIRERGRAIKMEEEGERKEVGRLSVGCTTWPGWCSVNPPFRPCVECCSGQPEKDAAVKLDQIPRGWLGPGLPFFFLFFFLDVSSP